MRILLLAALLAVTDLSMASSRELPTESAHVAGPNGLDSWTLNSELPELPGQGELPLTLIIARKGHVIRRIAGDPFIWGWMFQSNGRRVAYESGPLHSGMECILAEISSGKQVEDYDCFQNPLPAGAPAWVKDLERLSTNELR